MAGYYQTLQTADFKGEGIPEELWEGTRGQALMEELGEQVAATRPLFDRVYKLMNLYHDAMQGHWTWEPTGASAAGGALLDSSNLKGECAQLADGFKALLLAPSPYGLGLSAGDLLKEEWPPSSSRDVKMFVVSHAGAYFGLHPNVLKKEYADQVGAARFQDLYAWGNHKVVRVNCGGLLCYFDPCYNEYLMELKDMAEMVLTEDVMSGGRNPIVNLFRGRNRAGNTVSFKPVGSATPDLLKGTVKTADNRWPILVGPM